MCKHHVPIRAAAVCLVLAAIPAPRPVIGGEIDAAVLARLKNATAFLKVPDTGSSGTAFCVSGQGYFVTCAHVVEGLAAGAQVELFLQAGLPTEKKLAAKLVRVIPDLDVALAKADQPNLQFLVLGDTKTLKETDSIVACGFPFGTGLARADKAPEITLKTGRITALRRGETRIEALQIDAQLLPGNSGGPVVDEKGRVVGVAAVRTGAASLNFAIPVEALGVLLDSADVTEDPLPEISASDLAKPVTISFRVSFLRPPASDLSVTAWLGSEPEGTDAQGGRRLPIRSVGPERYEATFIPRDVIQQALGRTLRLDMVQDAGSSRTTVSGMVLDAPLTVGGKAIRLAAMSRIFPKTNKVVLHDGREIVGKVEGWDHIVASPDRRHPVPSGSVFDAVVVRPARTESTSLPLTIRVANRGSASTATHSLAVRGNPAQVVGPTAEPVVPFLYPSTEPGAPSVDPIRIEVGGLIGDLRFGAGGMVAVARLESERKLVVVDLASAKVAGEIPLTNGSTPFAAAAHEILIADGDKVERWTYRPLAPKGQARKWLAGRILDLACGGANSDQAAVLYDPLGASEIAFLEMRDSRSGGFLSLDSGTGHGYNPYQGLALSWSGDLLVGMRENRSDLWWLAGNELMPLEQESGGRLLPGDGGWICGGGPAHSWRGIQFNLSRRLNETSTLIPSTVCGLACVVPGTDSADSREGKPALGLFDLIRGEMLIDHWVELPEAVRDGKGLTPAMNTKSVDWLHRFLLCPQARTLVTMSADCRSLTLRKVDVWDALRRTGRPFAFATQPTTVAVSTGARQAFPLEVRAHQDKGLTYHLDSHSPGLSLDSDGVIQVAPDPAAGTAGQAVIRIVCPDGKEFLQRFDVRYR